MGSLAVRSAADVYVLPKKVSVCEGPSLLSWLAGRMRSLIYLSLQLAASSRV